MTEAEVTRQEMVSLLCMGDRTHSQLMDLLPEKCGTSAHSRDFEAFLEEVALYKQPNFEAGGNLLQGMYVPRGSVWEREYDPVHVLLRAVHRKDYQASMDRYTHFMRQNGRLKGSATPWPPFRLPRNVHPELVDPRKLLQCKTMQAALFIILFKALKDPEVPEQVLALAVYLLEMALQFHPHSVSQKCSLYRKHVDICYVCGKLGHRADVCPNPGETICRGCEIKNPDEQHQCDPTCKLCGGHHPTADKE
ncbi:E3 ubiquitin-protein ligase UBR3-like [Rhipicephalus sanguineus]|uniref:E3 ubiquitin-protein ligase UBR3-like n=1 Tax=Rhipicephalus sanguineus TaxID=34632 RepID=UPI0020C1C1BB|nr:E3 ubiquitin-protein ligase UBR3-like [Rhipicephalus sanguineus]